MVLSSTGATPVRPPIPINLLVLAGFCSAAALRVCDPLVPQLALEFERTAGSAGLVIVAFAVAYGLTTLVFGPLGDRFGKPQMMIVALSASAVAAGISALGNSFGALVIGRILWGIAAAGVIPLAMAWIGDSVAYEHRQTTLARFLTGTLTGMFSGQLAGGVFADSAFGWRGAFASLMMGYLLVASLLLRHLRKNRAPAGPALTRDEIGGPTDGQTDGLIDGQTDGLIDGQTDGRIDRLNDGLTDGVTDGRTGGRTGGRIGEVLRTPWARVVLLAAFAEGVFLIGPLTYIPTYLHQRFGLSLSAAAALTALHALGGLTYALFARAIVARLGERRMSLWGGVFMGSGFVLWWLTPHWGWAGVAALIAGFGTYLYHNTLQTHATQMTPPARGTAVALFAFCIFGGQALGAWLFGALIDRCGAAPMLAIAALALPLAGWGFARALQLRNVA